MLIKGSSVLIARVLITLILLLLLPCLFLTNLVFAANADVSGRWSFNVVMSPPMNVHETQISVLKNGTQYVYNNDTTKIDHPACNLNITQNPDGSFSGSNVSTNENSSYSQILTGKVTGSSVTFTMTTTFISTSQGESYGKIAETYTDDFSGSVSEGVLNGALAVSYLYEQETHTPGLYIEAVYLTWTGTGTTSISFKLPNSNTFDTIITSSPPATGTNRSAAFTYEGKNGNGGIAGYYYKLDTNPQVYTTQTTITFPKLELGNHVFSVAAKDKAGNIDQTPAVWNFTIEQPSQPNTTEANKRGPPKDKNEETGDPINVITGNMYVYTNDIKFPGKGLGFNFTRTYNSRDAYSGPLGYGWTHTYNVFLTVDSTNQLIKIRDGQAREILFRDDTYGSFIPQKGEYSTLTKTTTGYTWRLKEGTNFYFNTTGKLTKIVDRNLNTITLSYNTLNQLEKITDTVKRINKFTYDALSRISSVTTPAGKVYTYTYDSNNNLIKVSDPKAGNIIYEYDTNHNLFRKTLPNTKVITFTYDSNDRCTSSSGENNYERVNLVFTPSSNRTLVTNSKNNQTTYYYNNDYQIIEIIDALGNHTKSTWDTNLNLTSRTDAFNRTVNMEYDTKGNLIKLTDPLNNITNFTYEPVFCNLTSKTDALGNVTKYSYDTKGNLIKVINPLNASATYKYASGGLISSIANAYNKKISFTYDKYANLASTKDLAGITIKSTYDIMGNKITSTDQRGNVTRYYYDELNRLIKIILPDKISTNLFSYDAMDNLLSVTDALGKATTYTYNAAGKILTITDALSGVVTNTYDTEGNLLSIKDQKNNTTTYVYDELNRLISKTDAANYKWQYFYDCLGNRIKEIDPKGQVINYNYDELNRFENLNSPDVNISFNYDSLGRVTSMADSQGLTNYTYDAIGQLLTVDGPAANDTLTYTYDLVGNRKTLIDQDNNLTKYTYDAANRILTITDPQNKITKYTYDKYASLASLLYPNKTGAIYKYDSLGRLSKVVNQLSLKPYTKFSEFTYTYDALYRKTKVNTLDATTDYFYDGLGRLTREIRTSANIPYQISYTFDASGNRLSAVKAGITTSYTYNNLNQLTKETTGANYIDYNYDPNGNLIKSTPNTASSDNFYYDSLNRLNKVTGPALNEIYKYDGQGNRIQVSSSNVVTNFLYDGPNAILEKNVSQITTANFSRNPYAAGGIGGIISQQSTVNSPQYYHYEAQGSVVNTSSSASAKLNSYTYDSFGNVIASTGSTPNNRKFLTKEQDKTGLIYFGKRYYNPRIGRFITPDPMGMIDGPNVYLYCNNDPVNFVDPFGTLRTKIGDFEVELDSKKHGGLHLDVYYGGVNVGRFRLSDLSGIKHRGEIPTMPNSLAKALQKSGFLKKAMKKAGLIGLGAGIAWELMEGKGYTEITGDMIEGLIDPTGILTDEVADDDMVFVGGGFMNNQDSEEEKEKK